MEHEPPVINGFSSDGGAEIELSQIEDRDALREQLANNVGRPLRAEKIVREEEEEEATVNAIHVEESQRVGDQLEQVGMTGAALNVQTATDGQPESTTEEEEEEEEEEEAATSNRNRSSPAPSHHMKTELYNAALEGNEDVIQAVLRADGPKLRVQTQTGNSILHIHVAAPVDKRAANIPFLERVLVGDPTLVDLVNDRGETPLHVAAKFGQLEAVRTFLDGASELLMKTNKELDTALHMAVRNNYFPVVEFLLNLSDSVMMDYTVNIAGKNPLYLAAESGSTQLMNLLLEKFTVAQNGGEFTGSMLHAAVLQGNSDIVKTMMEKDTYKNLISTTDVSGLTPVHYAAGSNNDILEVLLQSETSSEAVYMRDRQGRTAAHLAAQCNDVAALKMIVAYYPDCCEIVDTDGRNVVHYAAMLGCGKALDYFLTDTRFSDIVAMEDCKGDTPLHVLAATIPDLPAACLRQVKLLIPKLKTWKLKKMYNNDNQTPGDVAHLREIYDMEPAYQDVMRDFIKQFPRDGYTKYWLQQPAKKYNELVIETQRKETALALLKAARNHLLVATLIATLAFAAGLNTPGGFNQDNKDDVNGGTAMLMKKPAFRVFLIADTASLTSSVIAILIYFVVNLGKGKGSAKILIYWAFGATSISMLALMVAFMAGTYSLVQPSTRFAISLVLIASLFIFCYAIFLCMFVSFIKAMSSIRRLEPRKLKTAV